MTNEKKILLAQLLQERLEALPRDEDGYDEQLHMGTDVTEIEATDIIIGNIKREVL